MSIIIGWSDFGSVKSRFMSSVNNCIINDSKDLSLIDGVIAYSGPLLSLNRNNVINSFLETDSEWLLMVDADTEWSVNDIYNLYNLAISNSTKVLSATYFSYDKNEKIKSLVFIENNGKKIPLNINEYINQEVVKVDWADLGGMIIHRDALTSTYCSGKNNIRYWFAEVFDDGFCGEDYFFFNNLKKHNIDVYVTPKIVIPHHKDVVLNSHKYFLEEQ